MVPEQKRPTVQTQQLRRIRILGRLDELDLAVAQDVELLFFETGPQQGIREEIQHQALIASQKLAPQNDRFGTCARAERPTHALHRIGEGEGIALAGTFFQKARYNRCSTGTPRSVFLGTSTKYGVERNERDVPTGKHDEREAVV